LKPKWPDVALKRQAKRGVMNEREELMNTTLKTKLAIVAAFAFVATASAFYNSEVGRWLSRDPIGERGGENVMAFVHNHPTIAYDALGQQCCLTTIDPGSVSPEDKSPLGHSILSCDNGVYISLWPKTDPPSHNKERDDKVYKDASQTITCFPCLDENKLKAWWDATGGSLEWSYTFNCADAVLAALEAGLPDQKKPQCPCVFGCYSYARNVLGETPSGTTPIFILPSDTKHRLQALVDNDCNKWKCTVRCTGKH
jgi:hypothetical protein